MITDGEARERSIYLSLRIKALIEELKTLRTDQLSARGQIRAATDKKTAEIKALKVRSIYYRLRIDEVQETIRLARDERKTIMDAAK